MCARMAYEALMEFARYLQTTAEKKARHLKHVHFVNIDQETTHAMARVMSSLYQQKYMFPSEPSENKPTEKASTEHQIHTGSVDTSARTDAGINGGTDAGTDAGIDVGTDGGTGTDGGGGTDADTGTGTDGVTSGDTGADTGTDAGIDPDRATDADAGTGTDSGTDAGTGTDADGGTGTDGGASASTGTDAGTDAGTDGGGDQRQSSEAAGHQQVKVCENVTPVNHQCAELTHVQRSDGQNVNVLKDGDGQFSSSEISRQNDSSRASCDHKELPVPANDDGSSNTAGSRVEIRPAAGHSSDLCAVKKPCKQLGCENLACKHCVENSRSEERGRESWVMVETDGKDSHVETVTDAAADGGADATAGGLKQDEPSTKPQQSLAVKTDKDELDAVDNDGEDSEAKTSVEATSEAVDGGSVDVDATAGGLKQDEPSTRPQQRMRALERDESDVKVSGVQDSQRDGSVAADVDGGGGDVNDAAAGLKQDQAATTPPRRRVLKKEKDEWEKDVDGEGSQTKTAAAAASDTAASAAAADDGATAAGLKQENASPTPQRIRALKKDERGMMCGDGSETAADTGAVDAANEDGDASATSAVVRQDEASPKPPRHRALKKDERDMMGDDGEDSEAGADSGAVDAADEDGDASATSADVKQDKASLKHSRALKKEDCVICLETISDVKELDCGHRFCTDCIVKCFEVSQPKCPSCGKLYGMLRGNQPPGTFSCKTNRSVKLSGYGRGALVISYDIPSGIQTVSVCFSVHLDCTAVITCCSLDGF